MNDLKEFKELLRQVEQQGLDIAILSCSNKNFHNQDWEMLSADPNLSEDLLIKYCDFLSWNVVSIHYKFDLQTLKRFEDKIDWGVLGTNTFLTQSFVLKHRDKVNWRIIVTYQNFSRAFWKKAIRYVPSPWIRDTIRQRYNIK